MKHLYLVLFFIFLFSCSKEKTIVNRIITNDRISEEQRKDLYQKAFTNNKAAFWYIIYFTRPGKTIKDEKKAIVAKIQNSSNIPETNVGLLLVDLDHNKMDFQFIQLKSHNDGWISKKFTYETTEKYSDAMKNDPIKAVVFTSEDILNKSAQEPPDYIFNYSSVGGEETDVWTKVIVILSFLFLLLVTFLAMFGKAKAEDEYKVIVFIMKGKK